ncbi:hypothetical protein ACWFMI_12515 [Nocardiopsis terrae]
MVLLHLLLAAMIGWMALIVAKPQVAWYVRAWRYRDPEANYPSDTWFTLHRVGAAVAIVLCLFAWSLTWESAPDEAASESVTAQESAAAPEDDIPVQETVSLTDTSPKRAGSATTGCWRRKRRS